MDAPLYPWPGLGIIRCPKCQWDGNISISYFSADAKCAHPGGPSDGIASLIAYKRVWGRERMHRTCGTCGYTWDHECADAAADDAR